VKKPTGEHCNGMEGVITWHRFNSARCSAQTPSHAFRELDAGVLDDGGRS
jgi:hypothetical protein